MADDEQPLLEPDLRNALGSMETGCVCAESGERRAMASALSRGDPATAGGLAPTVSAAVNVAEYGFEGRFEDWAGDARYVEYDKAADPIGSGDTSRVPVRTFSPELYTDGPSRIVPLGLSDSHLTISPNAPVAGPPSATSPSGSARHQRPSSADHYRTMGSTQC